MFNNSIITKSSWIFKFLTELKLSSYLSTPQIGMINIMIKQTKKYRVAFITLVSAVLFCYLLVVSSLSPLANSGHNANQFNSLDMWSAIGTVLLFYIIPLIVYMLGVESMKFVMSVILSLGLLIDFSLIAVIFMLNLTTKNKFSSLIGVIGLCIVSLIVNIIWFFVAFPPSSKIKN